MVNALLYHSLSLSLSSFLMCPQVNGFEVYDPEEAVLLFLEQDQDITLTVARKIKVIIGRDTFYIYNIVAQQLSSTTYNASTLCVSL